ncbi:circularly permuted type 2 ATP-grasp protein [Elioraea sp.]|uniref:circularly permuted type 2 ATP-grasp protein n=1 Tax=Elioraea sp. TaxID=2185103 RepID=UPI003F71E7A7
MRSDSAAAPLVLPAPPFWDEMVDGRGAVRTHWRNVAAMLASLPPGGLADRALRLDRAFEEEGITTLLPADPGGATVERPWRCDPVPMVLAAHEFAALESGLAQRARLLAAILADLYGPQRLLAEGALPPALVFANPGFLRPCRTPSPSQPASLHLIAADLVRGPDGDWRVLADRTGAPNGIGFARENRRMVARTMPEGFRISQVRELRPFFELWNDALQRLAPSGVANPRIGLLTAGTVHETWFEHLFLSRELGLVLVEGADLTARDGRVFLKTLKGLQRVDVLLRRVEGRLVDPLELTPDSVLGVAGLLDAMRADGVRVANDPGSHLTEAPALAAFLPMLAERLLGEALLLESVPTLWLGEPDALRTVLADPTRWLIRPALDGAAPAIAAAELSDAALLGLLDRVRATPRAFAATRAIQPSAAPALGEGGLAPKPIVLRLFMLADGSGAWRTMPGGLARVIEEADRLAGRLPRRGVAKDVWVLSGAEGEIGGMPLVPLGPLAIRRTAAELPSRAADDLYWLGRQVERIENAARLVRAMLARLTRGWLLPHDIVELRTLAHCLSEAGVISEEAAALPPDGQAMPRALMDACRRQRPLMLMFDRVFRLARAVRDRLTGDMWATIAHLSAEAREATAAGARDFDALAPATAAIIRFSAGVSGIAAENMVRGGGWIFLDLGRRIERAAHTARDLAHALDQPLQRVEAGLRLALELCDSVITYRSRYLTVLQSSPVLDLVLADPSNPRAIAYQLYHVERRLAEVGGAPEGDLAMVAGRLRAEVEAMVERVASAEEPALEAIILPTNLREFAAAIAALSDAIARRYFSHVPATQSLGFGDEEQVEG